MFYAIEGTISKTQVTADNIADLVVLAKELQPRIRASAVGCGDTEDIRRVRNRMLYCKEDIAALANTLIDVVEMLNENLDQLNELLS